MRPPFARTRFKATAVSALTSHHSACITWSRVFSGGPVKIYGVEFDAQPERDRVVVLAEQAVDYLVYEPDPSPPTGSYDDVKESLSEE